MFWGSAVVIYGRLKNYRTVVRVVAAGVGGFAMVYAVLGVILLLTWMFGLR